MIVEGQKECQALVQPCPRWEDQDTPELETTCCAPLIREPLAAEEASDLATTFKALADPARLRLPSLIASHEGGDACVCDLTEPVDLSQPTVSHHLKILTDAGLLTRDKRGKWAYYAVVPQALDTLGEVLRVAHQGTPLCGGRPRLRIAGAALALVLAGGAGAAVEGWDDNGDRGKHERDDRHHERDRSRDHTIRAAGPSVRTPPRGLPAPRGAGGGDTRDGATRP